MVAYAPRLTTPRRRLRPAGAQSGLAVIEAAYRLVGGVHLLLCLPQAYREHLAALWVAKEQAAAIAGLHPERRDDVVFDPRLLCRRRSGFTTTWVTRANIPPPPFQLDV